MARKAKRTPDEELKLLNEYLGVPKLAKADWLKAKKVKPTLIPYFKKHLEKLGMWGKKSGAKKTAKVSRTVKTSSNGNGSSFDQELMRLGLEAKVASYGGTITWGR